MWFGTFQMFPIVISAKQSSHINHRNHAGSNTTCSFFPSRSLQTCLVFPNVSQVKQKTGAVCAHDPKTKLHSISVNREGTFHSPGANVCRWGEQNQLVVSWLTKSLHPTLEIQWSAQLIYCFLPAVIMGFETSLLCFYSLQHDPHLFVLTKVKAGGV